MSAPDTTAEDAAKAPMIRAASLFSGIGAPEQAMPGWDWLWHAEIEPFPSAVMAARHPRSVNLGDVTAPDFCERAGRHGPLDVLVAGPPCQDFSTAGQRAGLSGERGDLSLRALDVVGRLRPRWVVIENVPGLISVDDGDALRLLLDRFEALGYLPDLDVLDAQHHGLAQRRRRLFVVGRRADSILAAGTLSSALSLAQLVAEVSALCLAALSGGPPSADWIFDASDPVDALGRRLKLFGLPGRAAELADGLAPLRRWCGRERADDWRAALLGDEEGYRAAVGDLLRTAGECAASAGSATGLYSCAAVLVHTAARLTQSMDCSPCFWTAAASTLIAIREFIDHARQAGGDVFALVEGNEHWRHLLRQAERAGRSLGDTGVRGLGEVLPLAEGLRGCPPPPRARGQGAGSAPAGRAGGEGEIVDAVAIGDAAQIVAAGGDHGMGASINDVPHALVPVPDWVIAIQDGRDVEKGQGGVGVSDDGIAYTLDTTGAQAVAFAQNQLGEVRISELVGTLGTNSNASGRATPMVAVASVIRRLTPRECERLMGLPDDYTLISYRGRPATDGPRYRALGNSKAVPVMRRILGRIERVDAEAAVSGAPPTRDAAVALPLDPDCRELPLDAVLVGERHRRVLGDLSGLIESIEDIGLLDPISVDRDGRLLAGVRRLAACKRMGWTEIPVRVVSESGTAP